MRRSRLAGMKPVRCKQSTVVGAAQRWTRRPVRVGSRAISRPGTFTSSHWLAMSRLTSLEHYKGERQLTSVRYGLDGVGNRLTTSQRTACGSASIACDVTYGYDALDRVTRATTATPRLTRRTAMTSPAIASAPGSGRTRRPTGTTPPIVSCVRTGPQQLAGLGAEATVCLGSGNSNPINWTGPTGQFGLDDIGDAAEERCGRGHYAAVRRCFASPSPRSSRSRRRGGV
jgi:hypothetical protein